MAVERTLEVPPESLMLATAAAPVGSPKWWRGRLLEALDRQAARVELLERYVDGNHPLPDPPKAMQQSAWEDAKAAFINLSRLGVTNFMPLVAKAPSNRLTVTGFRFGETTGDSDGWAIWQANHLDADSRLLHDTAFNTGQAYALVWPGEDGEQPVITCEHPSQMIVAYQAGSRWRRAAALKRWTAEDGRLHVTLYTPEFLFKWRTRSPRPGYGQAMGFGNAYEQRQPAGEDWPLPNPLGAVPVVEFAVNADLRARPYGGGVAEFEPVLAIQNRINKTVFDRLVTGESQAFRQRYAIGWSPPVNPDTGQPDPRLLFQASQSRMGLFPKDVKVGEFEQADFTGFLKGVEDDVRWLVVITFTPPSYLPVDLKNLGAETIAQTNAGFIDKTKNHRDRLTESWEEVLRLALRAKKDRRADDPSTTVMWADIEIHTMAEQVDALLKLKGVLPLEELLSRVPHATPQDVKRWLKQLTADALRTEGAAALADLIGGGGDGTGTDTQPPAG